MKYFLTHFFIVSLSFWAPSLASAHSVPVHIDPAMGSVMSVSPKEVRIQFSEHIKEGSPALKLFFATATPVLLPVTIDPVDSHVVSAPLPPLAGGVTIVWGVISGDDGHFTRGAFNFVVGRVNEAASPSPRDMLIPTIFVLLVLLVLRLTSLFFLERRARCADCVRAYTLIEGGVGVVLFLSAFLLFSFPVEAPWVASTAHDGMTTELRGRVGSDIVELAYSGAGNSKPLVQIEQRAAGIDSMEVALTQVPAQDGLTHFSFPKAVFTPEGLWHVSLTFVYPDRYDVERAFDLDYPTTIDQASEPARHHMIRMGVLLGALLLILLVFYRVVRVVRLPRIEEESGTNPLVAYGTALFALLVIVATYVLLLAVV